MVEQNPAPADSAWPLVSVLFITYKRIDLLERAVASFHAQIDYPNFEVIIADDGSPVNIQEQIEALPYSKRTVLPRVNRGLGANINQGMEACRGDFILMIQDDWICEGPPDALKVSVRLLMDVPDIGLVHYTMGLRPRAETVRYESMGQTAYIYPDDPKHREYHVVYSDQPHLRRREVNDFMGPYKVDKDVLVCERDYEQRWDKQTRYRSAMFPVYWLTLFTNAGADRSLREENLRYKADKLVRPLAKSLERYPAVFKPLRRAWRGLLKLFKANL